MTELTQYEQEILSSLAVEPKSRNALKVELGRHADTIQKATLSLMDKGLIRNVGMGSLTRLELVDPDRAYAQPEAPAEPDPIPSGSGSTGSRVSLAEELLEIERCIADAEKRRAEILESLR